MGAASHSIAFDTFHLQVHELALLHADIYMSCIWSSVHRSAVLASFVGQGMSKAATVMYSTMSYVLFCVMGL